MEFSEHEFCQIVEHPEVGAEMQEELMDGGDENVAAVESDDVELLEENEPQIAVIEPLPRPYMPTEMAGQDSQEDEDEDDSESSEEEQENDSDIEEVAEEPEEDEDDSDVQQGVDEAEENDDNSDIEEVVDETEENDDDSFVQEVAEMIEESGDGNEVHDFIGKDLELIPEIIEVRGEVECEDDDENSSEPEQEHFLPKKDSEIDGGGRSVRVSYVRKSVSGNSPDQLSATIKKWETTAENNCEF